MQGRILKLHGLLIVDCADVRKGCRQKNGRTPRREFERGAYGAGGRGSSAVPLNLEAEVEHGDLHGVGHLALHPLQACHTGLVWSSEDLNYTGGEA